MEIGVGVGCAVRCNQKLCSLKVGRMDRCQLDLHRPVAQAGNRLHRGRGCTFAVLRLFQHPHPRAGAAALVEVLHLLLQFLFLFVFLHRSLIISRGFPLLKGDGSGGAARQTISKAVAEIFPHQLCLAVDNVDGSLMAGSCTESTAVAFFFVNMDDLPNHIYFLLLWVFFAFAGLL